MRAEKISYLLVGHTKFAPWPAKAEVLHDTGRVPDRSCLCGRSVRPCPVSRHGGQNSPGGPVRLGGGLPVLFRKGGIKSLHHLVFSSAAPGTAVVNGCNAEGKTLTLLKKDHQGWKPFPNQLLPVLPPPGLSLERRRYLYEKIQDYVPDPHKDVVCVE